MRRPVLESGTAHKVLKFSETPDDKLTKEYVEKSINTHTKVMRRELQLGGWLVTRIDRLAEGDEGDVKLIAKIAKLGTKESSHARRLARLEGSKKDGRVAPQAGAQESRDKADSPILRPDGSSVSSTPRSPIIL